MYGPMIHSIGRRPSRAVFDGTLTCGVGFSGYLSAAVCAIPGNTDRPNPKSNRNETTFSMRMCFRPCYRISLLDFRRFPILEPIDQSWFRQSRPATSTAPPVVVYLMTPYG